MKMWTVVMQDQIISIEADGIYYNLDNGSIYFSNQDFPEIPIAFFKQWDAFWEEKKIDART